MGPLYMFHVEQSRVHFSAIVTRPFAANAHFVRTKHTKVTKVPERR
jgi:hypothetical protein